MQNQNILCLQFNNYFNRISIRHETVEDYIRNSSTSDYSRDEDGNVCEVNFIPNDDIVTKMTLNWTNEWNPDYVLVIHRNAKNEEVIESRWYIKEKVRLCEGQLEVTLKRDSVTDKIESVLNSPCFIEKGFVAADNPLIFNKEDFSCNQIKVSETKLHDNTYISWLIAYYNLSEKSHLEGDVTTTEQPYINLGVADISSWGLIQKYNTDGYVKPVTPNFSIDVDMANTSAEGRITFDSNVNLLNSITNQDNLEDWDTQLEYDESGFFFADNAYRLNKTKIAVVNCINSNKATIKTRLNAYAQPSDAFESVVFYNNKIVKTNDGKFYRITVRPIESNIVRKYLDVSGAATTNGENELVAAIESSFKTGGVFKTGFSGNFTDAIYMEYFAEKYEFSYVEITNSIQNYHYDFKNVKDIIDAPYGIIAFPFKAVYDYTRIAVDNNNDVIVNDLAMEIIRDMTKDGIGGSNKIFDVQILPFCPITRLLPLMTGLRVRFNLTNDLNANEYTIIKDSNNNLGTFALHPTTSKFTLNISKSLSVQNVKFENQCEFYRLCSPNWASCFEFNLARNGGLNYFNVDCTYKPYQPYIHINPDFNLLYGQDFNDARGLIFSGDFSISSISNAFETYALNNKNYQEMFNRQIEHLDTEHTIAQDKMFGQLATTAGTGALAFGAGALLGHPAAMAGGIGAMLGGLGSSLTNYITENEQYKEDRSQAIDMHNFNLQNIKAKPDTLTKVSASNNNNKIFPVLEKYSCTEEEKVIFLDKIKYEGMTVNAIGHIGNYLDSVTGETFIKGKFIRLEGLNEESHFANDIYNEIATGIFIRR